jgi:RNA polymerase primary sigma factor
MEHMCGYIDEDMDPTTRFEEKETKKVLLAAINRLPEMEREVIKMRSGINDEHNEGRTYQQIGDVFSLSKQRIEQIYSRAVSKLRKNTQLKDFFDDAR